jgi:hypothetical protein
MKKHYAIVSFILCMSWFSLTAPASAAGTTTTTTKTTITTSNIANFDTTSLVKTDGSYWEWSGFFHTVPTQIHGLTDVETTYPDQLFMKNDHTVWHWDRTSPLSVEAQVYPVKELNNLVAVYFDYRKSLALDAGGKVYLLPKTEGKLNLDQIVPLSDMDNVASISSYSESSKKQWDYRRVFLKKDGTVWIDSDDLNSFESIQFLDHVVAIGQNMALKEDGTVWTWPAVFTSDELPTDQLSAAKMDGLANIQAIKTTSYSNLAIDSQSRLWFWGGTITGWSEGRTYNIHPTPIQLTSIKDVKDAYVVETSLIALTGDGKVYETSIEREDMPGNPIFKLLASDVNQIKSGGRHIIFQKTNGSLWGWGFNKNSELGFGGSYEMMVNTPVPVQMPITVELNGEPVFLTNGVITRNDQSFIPIRSVFEKLGATVSWDNEKKIATITRSKASKSPIIIHVNYTTGITDINEEPVTLKIAPFGVSGTSYLPLRFISESLGATVDWVQKEDKISITMK